MNNMCNIGTFPN